MMIATSMPNPTDNVARRPVQAADLPTVSAILLSYNCEQFIAQAVDSVLSQDYRGPLEIILSDDASTDETFGRLQERAAAYRGPHRIEMMRRSVNAGSKSGHLNGVFPAARGEILVSFDGDDIAEPSRVTKLVERFCADNAVQAAYSSYSLIDAFDRPRGKTTVPHPPKGSNAAEWFARVDAYAAGSTLAVRRWVVTEFGPLDPNVHEDVVLPFRASLLGRVEFIDEPLVKLRSHAESLTADWQRFTSLAHYRARMELGIERAKWAMRGRLDDIRTAAAREPQCGARWEELREIVHKSFRNAEATQALTSSSFAARVRALFELVRAGAYRDELPQHACIALMPRLYLRYKRYKLGTRRPESGVLQDRKMAP